MTMMKMKNRFRMVLLCVLSALFLVSCQKAGEPLTLVLSSDKTFTDQAATLTLTLSQAAPSEITVRLSARETPLSGKPSVPAAKLSFPQSVSIAPGSSSATVDVTLAEDATGAQAIIEIAGVTGGATLAGDGAAVIATGQSYSGGEQGGEQGGEGGEQGGEGGEQGALTLSLQSNWTARILDGDLEDDGTYYYYPVSVTAPGSTYLWLETLTDDELDDYYKGDIAAMLADYAGIEEGSTVGESFYTASETVYVTYYGAGKTKCYIMDYDAQGNPTGKYGVVELDVPDYEAGDDEDDEVPEIPFTGTPVLKPGWTLSIEEVGTDEYGDYILVDVTTDAQLFLVGYYTEAEMVKYFGSTDVAPMLTYFQSQAVADSKTGGYESPSAYFWTPEDDVYCNYYEGYENGTDFYIMEFGTDWLATGNYGKVHLNVPVLSGARQPLRVKIAPQHKRAPEVKLISKRRKK